MHDNPVAFLAFSLVAIFGWLWLGSSMPDWRVWGTPKSKAWFRWWRKYAVIYLVAFVIVHQMLFTLWP